MPKFQCIPHDVCTCARLVVEMQRPERMARLATLATAQRCRQCGDTLAPGEEVVAFHYNFTPWPRWLFMAYIHREPCEHRPLAPTTRPPRTVTVAWL